MAEQLQALEETVSRRYKVALIFCVPLFLGFLLMLADSVWGISVLPASGVFALIVVGLLIAAVPVTRYNRAKDAFVAEVRKANLTAVAKAFESDK